MRPWHRRSKAIRWLVVIGALFLALTLIAMAAVPPLMMAFL